MATHPAQYSYLVQDTAGEDGAPSAFRLGVTAAGSSPGAPRKTRWPVVSAAHSTARAMLPETGVLVDARLATRPVSKRLLPDHLRKMKAVLKAKARCTGPLSPDTLRADPSADKVTATHLMYGNLCGLGRMAIPASQLDAFCELVEADYRAGHVYAITENKSVVHCTPFFVDVDAQLPREPTGDQLEALAAHVTTTVARFFPDEPPSSPKLRATVAASAVAPVRMAGAPTGSFKVGVHMYFPQLPCTVEMMLYMVEAVIQDAPVRLAATWPDTPTFEGVVDRKVYHGTTGLRWVWQLKAAKCVCAQTEGRTRCTLCDGYRFCVDTGASMYVPVLRMGGDGTVEHLPSTPGPTVALLKECSLRVNLRLNAASGFRPYAGAPPPDLSLAFPHAAVGEVTQSPQQLLALTHAVQAHHPKYATVALSKVTERVTKGKGKVFTVFVKSWSEGARFCQHVDREHEHATVKFEVTALGVVQRCHAANHCKDFRSYATPLTPSQQKTLFPLAVAAAEDRMAARQGQLTPLSGGSWMSSSTCSGGPLVSSPLPSRLLLTRDSSVSVMGNSPCAVDPAAIVPAQLRKGLLGPLRKRGRDSEPDKPPSC